MHVRFGLSLLLVPCLIGVFAACGEDGAPAESEERSPSESDDDEAEAPNGNVDAGGRDRPKVDASNGRGADASNGSRDGGKIDAGRSGANGADAAPAANPTADGAVDAGTPLQGEPDASKVDGGDPDSVPKLKPKCVSKDSQVIIIGDSYFNWISHSFPQDIIKETGQRWRMEAIGAWAMGSGGIGLIPDQFHMSIERDPDAHTVLMTGGGNDVLVADPMLDPNGTCKTDKAPTTPGCQKIVETALAAADKLLASATEAGIRDVVYVFYPHVPNGTLIGGPNPNAILDYTLPKVKKFCDDVEGKSGGKTRCHFVDLVPVFEGHDDWFFPGDIHENSTGSAEMAKTIWAKMKSECVGQKSGDCCEP